MSQTFSGDFPPINWALPMPMIFVFRPPSLSAREIWAADGCTEGEAKDAKRCWTRWYTLGPKMAASFPTKGGGFSLFLFLLAFLTMGVVQCGTRRTTGQIVRRWLIH